MVACPSDVKGVAGAPVGERVKGVMLKNVASSRAVFICTAFFSAFHSAAVCTWFTSEGLCSAEIIEIVVACFHFVFGSCLSEKAFMHYTFVHTYG